MNKKLRQQVFDKYGGHCAYCGCKLKEGWHVDHVEPIRRSRYWDCTTGKWVDAGCVHPERDCVENMMPSCPSCNINKHGDTIEGFRQNIVGYLNSLNLRMVQYKMVKKYGLVQETGNEVKFFFETYPAE